jgi:class 3 adenylate cyclase/tetratricopeptide (TPR) repeat protein
MIKCPGCGEENPPKFRLCGYCGAALSAAAQPTLALPTRDVRKTVTIIFCDLKGSTALTETLDPEAMHEVKDRYFAAMAAEITRHGGKIEKYIGDAIMAVFGLPRANEDDALRAVRAAAGMQATLARVNAELSQRYGVMLANRTGVNTGEVVANNDPTADQKLATGDAVNVAARLEQAAPVNQILLGELTWRLVRDAVEVEPVEPLELKGKSQPVPAYRLVSAAGLDGLVRRHDAPIVGREAELATLREHFEAVVTQRVVHAVTLVGDAGLGKTRLVREVIHGIAAGARVLSGRCLPYGDGITFWPLFLMLREAADIGDDDPAEAALRKLHAAVGDARVAERLAAATGLGPGAFSLAETNWAARKFLQRWAADGPLVVFVDDIHWAEPAFLDLLDHLRETTTETPILVLATSRPDLFEERPQWGTTPDSVRITLKPLGDADAAKLVAHLLGGAGLDDDVVPRIVDAAEGNPLYAEQMLSMLVDDGTLQQVDGRWVRTQPDVQISVPPTIQALLEARLDRLARAERAVVEPASVIGVEFPQPAVAALSPEAVRAGVVDHLAALTRKQFVRPSQAAKDDFLYRFHHHLVRDTVYNGLLKRARATLHLEFVRWADQWVAASDRGLEFQEILGYHLEQAHRYLKELGPLDDEGLTVGRDAARRLGAAGQRATARDDMAAAAGLLRRAAALLEADDPQRWPLLPDLAEALIGMGDYTGARDTLREAGAVAERTSNFALQALCRLLGRQADLYSGEQQDWSAETTRTCDELIPRLERDQSHEELAIAWRLRVLVHGMAGRYSLASEAVSHSSRHARLAGHSRLVARNAEVQAANLLYGPVPVREAIAECESMLQGGLQDQIVECYVTCAMAQLRSMDGDVGAARALVQGSRRRLRDLGQGVFAASTAIDLARVELNGGDLQRVWGELQVDHDYLAARGETYFLSTLAALMGRVARELGRDDEAIRLSESAQAASADDDLESQALWRMVRAPVLARRGELAAAEALAREAVEFSLRTEAPLLQADSFAELAVVLEAAGRRDAAVEAIDEALARYDGKGHRAAAVRWEAWQSQVLSTPG